jgi:ubiquinone/menaquinone biosynthesis C-methylase UbiE
VAEVQRVLKPGGRFFFEEVTAHALSRWAYRACLRHPTDDRFTDEMFIAELQRNGLDVMASPSRFFGDFVIGVGRRRA